MKKYMVEEGASFEQDKIYIGGMVYNHRYHYVLSQKINIFQPKEVVLPAISMDMARGMVKEKECYIVRIPDSDEDEFDFPDGIIGTGQKKNQYF